MNIRIISLLIVSLSFATVSLANFFEGKQKPALTADTNRDGNLTLDTVKKGQDLILIKPNPAKLSKDDLIFQTKNYNLYTAVTWQDLQNSDAFKKIMLGKVAKDGTIRIYTLPNLGYTAVQTMSKSTGESEIYLLTGKGKLDKIVKVDYELTPFPIYDLSKESKVKAS